MALLGGAGGLSASAGGGGPSSSGNRDVSSATGAKNLNIGGNPNVSQALANPWLIGGVLLLAAVWIIRRRK